MEKMTCFMVLITSMLVICSGCAWNTCSHYEDYLTMVVHEPYFIFKTPEDPAINESMREEFLKSSFNLTFHVNNSIESYESFKMIKYQFNDNDSLIQFDDFYELDMAYEREIVYDFSIKFTTNSTNETLQGFSIFSKKWYIYGSFILHGKDDDTVLEWNIVDGDMNLTEMNEVRLLYFISQKNASKESAFALNISLKYAAEEVCG